jgi:hypothetical protein
MKLLLTSLFLVASLSAMAQRSTTSRTHTSIDDDDRTMKIKIEGTVNGREVSYNRRFNVEGMKGTEKEALKNRVFDSLGISEPPKAPLAPAAPDPHSAITSPVTRGSRNERKSEGTNNHTSPKEETVTFVCKSCTGKMRLEVTGENYGLTHESDTNKRGHNSFPITVSMVPGKYEYVYWQNGVQQMRLPFEVKTNLKNEVTVK